MSFIFPLWEEFWKVAIFQISFVIFALIFIGVKIKDFYYNEVAFSETQKNFGDIVKIIYRKIFSLTIYSLGIIIKDVAVAFLKLVKLFWKNLLAGYFVSWTGGVALFFLGLCPFLLVFKKDAIAEQSAIYAYYFLVISVVLMIIENFNNKGQENDDI